MTGINCNFCNPCFMYWNLHFNNRITFCSLLHVLSEYLHVWVSAYLVYLCVFRCVFRCIMCIIMYSGVLCVFRCLVGPDWNWKACQDPHCSLLCNFISLVWTLNIKKKGQLWNCWDLIWKIQAEMSECFSPKNKCV